MRLITGLANTIEIYCEHNHEEPIPMYMKEGAGMGKDSFYACPKYYPENREEGERACGNNLSITDYLKMVNYLDKIMTEAELNGEHLILTNLRFKIGQVQYHVISHTRRKLKIGVVNRKALNK